MRAAILPVVLLALALLGGSSCQRATVALVTGSALMAPGSGDGSGLSAPVGSPQPVIAQFTGAGNQQAATLSWQVSAADTLTIIPAVAGSGVLPLTGSVSITPTAPTTSYGLVATNAYGTTSAVVTIGPVASNATTPSILSVAAGPSSSTNYFDRTTTFQLVGVNLSQAGNNQVQSNCPGAGLSASDLPNPVQKIGDTLTTDGTGHVSLDLEFAIPQVATTCVVMVTRPDGVAAPPVTLQPYWLTTNLTYSLTGIEGENDGLPRGSVATLQISGAAAASPVWIGWYYGAKGSEGGQSSFTQVATNTSGVSDANGDYSMQFGGCQDIRDDESGGYFVLFVIGHQIGEIYYPINAGKCT